VEDDYNWVIECWATQCPPIDLSGKLAFEVADEPREASVDLTYVELPPEPGDPEDLLDGCPPSCRPMLQFVLDNFMVLEESDLIDTEREKTRSEAHHKTNKGMSRTAKPATPLALRWWTRTGSSDTPIHGLLTKVVQEVGGGGGGGG
jgi:hypothetical protein